MGINFLFLSKTIYYKRELTPYIFYRTFIILFLFIAVIYVFHCSNSNDSDKEFHPSDKEFHPSYMEWECRVCEGFHTDDLDFDVKGLVWFKGYLYAGVEAQRTKYPYNLCLKVYRSENYKDWETVVGDETKTPCGFGYAWNGQLHQLQVFQDYLYCVVSNELWRTPNGVDWEPIASEEGVYPRSFGDSEVMDLVCMAVFKEQLYLAFGRLSGGQIWRTSNGLHWEQVVGDNAETPSGFGIEDRQFFQAHMVVFKDQLYISSINSGVFVYRSSDGLHWDGLTIPETEGETYFVKSMQVYKDRLYIGTQWLGVGGLRGGKIFMSEDGITWTLSNKPGFGFDENSGIYSMCVFKDWLFAGTSNDEFGCEIWVTNDGSNWLRGIHTGFYRNFEPGRNIQCSAMISLNNSLFAGTMSHGLPPYGEWGGKAEIWRGKAK